VNRKERTRLEMEIKCLKKYINQKRKKPQQNDAARLARILGAYAQPAARALEKMYLNGPEILQSEFRGLLSGTKGAINTKESVVFEARQKCGGKRSSERSVMVEARQKCGANRFSIQPPSSRRRPQSCDPDSPSRRKELQDQVCIAAADRNLSACLIR